MRIDARPYANMALRYIISPQLQTEAVLWRRVRSPAGRGAEPCGLARQNTPAEDPRGKNPDRGKGRAGCGRKEAMLTRCRRGAYRSGFCCNSAARPQRQRVRITASAANQRQEQPAGPRHLRRRRLHHPSRRADCCGASPRQRPRGTPPRSPGQCRTNPCLRRGPSHLAAAAAAAARRPGGTRTLPARRGAPPAARCDEPQP